MDDISEIGNFSTFLSRFEDFEKRMIDTRITGDIASFTTLFTNYRKIDNALSHILLTTAPNYNIFKVLNVRHYETKLHTPFLKHLLSPDENHQQGTLFLNSFLQNFCSYNIITEPICNIHVYEEFSTEKGRIDILIKFKQNNENKVVVIENKIYGDDKDKQLTRYFEYITDLQRYKKGNYRIIYLKPYRSDPSQVSISYNLLHQLKIEKSYISIGYHEDIIPWLENMVPSVKANHLGQIVIQYLEILKTL